MMSPPMRRLSATAVLLAAAALPAFAQDALPAAPAPGGAVAPAPDAPRPLQPFVAT